MRIGILGGTFDPPHLGHLVVASDAFERLALDRLILVPSATPPHKHGSVQATAAQRLAMVRAAVAGDARFEVDDLELRRPGPSYTVDTLRAMRDRFPGCEILFLIGVDAARELPSWREPGEVARLARLAVLSRGGETLPTEGGEPPLRVEVTRIDISATAIRERVARGLPIRYHVPEPVRAIIEREGLYRRQS
jgi:nicotinate-nucleotide adenylyltransferase